jgi:transglutaminase-like putative cysteine protease
MRLHVRHRTEYAYDTPIPYAIQTLRLTPSPYAGLSVLRWQVLGGYGNIARVHTINRPHTAATVLVVGVVETSETHGVVHGAVDTLPPAFYLRSTRLTEANAALRDLSHGIGGNSLEHLHRLMLTVRERIRYRIGTTEVETTAAVALAAGTGVCQDHAHVFLAAARLLGVPARYVSGYLWTGHDEQEFEANHAWAEAYVSDLGWVGFDPANGTSPTAAYIRTATGLDYWSAAPVRGLRHGLASERLSVGVRVRQTASQQ